MIVLFTDFGAEDIYVPQLKAALLRHAPGALIIDLLHNAPNFEAKAGAHLLAALQDQFPTGAVFLAVVDPGVGGSRDPVIINADGKWFVGPDNGLLSVCAVRAKKIQSWRIDWRPNILSASFHGRDLFAPIAAWIAKGTLSPDKIISTAQLSTLFEAGDLAEIIYIDHYGNGLTGLRACNLPRDAIVKVGEHRLGYSRVFAEAPFDTPFWYENSLGLVEIAVNRGNAAKSLRLKVGDSISPIAPPNAAHPPIAPMQ